MTLRSFTDLIVWKKAHEAVLEVYRVTRRFPNEERFSLVVQMRRAAVSVPANIAEGFGRRSHPERARFYTIARSSAEELKYYLMLSKDLAYCQTIDSLWSLMDEVCRMLWRLTERTREGDAR